MLLTMFCWTRLLFFQGGLLCILLGCFINFLDDPYYEPLPVVHYVSLQIVVTGGNLKDCQEALDLAKTNGINRMVPPCIENYLPHYHHINSTQTNSTPQWGVTQQGV